MDETAALDEGLTAGDADNAKLRPRADRLDDLLEELEVADRGTVAAGVDRAVGTADGTPIR
jgi:hypothetical protein